MPEFENPNHNCAGNWLIIITLTFLNWAAIGGWFGWQEGGLIGAFIGISCASILFILGIVLVIGYPQTAVDVVSNILVISGAPLGAVISLILGKSVLLGVISGIIFGILIYFLLNKLKG